MSILLNSSARICAFLAICFFAACASTGGSQSPVTASTHAQVEEANYGRLLNQTRIANGLGTLAHNPKLSDAARGHAKDMNVRDYFEHNSPEGKTPKRRASAQGFKACMIAENIAWGQPNAATVHDGWMNSPGHRRNILYPRATQYGVGEFDGHWVLVLARPC